MDRPLREQAVIVSVLLVLLFWGFHAFAGETTINYKGMPPNSYAPSISAFGNDMCKSGISGGANNGIIALSGGITIVDETCEKIKLSRQLDSIGLKVAAVSILCSDMRVWEALEMSGTTCPFGGAVQDAARQAWFERHPERFEKLYGKDWRPPTVTYPME